jgi:hypothetical protein
MVVMWEEEEVVVVVVVLVLWLLLKTRFGANVLLTCGCPAAADLPTQTWRTHYSSPCPLATTLSASSKPRKCLLPL